MKKYILVLGMIACMLSLTACSPEATKDFGVTEEQVVEYAKGMVEDIHTVVTMGGMEQYESEPVIYEGLKNFSQAIEEIGEYQSVLGHTVQFNDGIVVELEIQGTLRKASFQIVMDEEGTITSISTNAIYSFGETMAKAGLNTLMGMGTVFSVLILIIFVISGFSLIGKVQDRKKAPEEIKFQQEDKTVEQIIEREEQTDDLELVAVIAAAVAAYEGSGSTDNYVVRSIKRRYR